MNNWKVIFATAVIFGAGVITGGLLVNYVQRCKGMPAKFSPAVAPVSSDTAQTKATNQPAAKPQRPPEILSKDFLQRLDKELELTKTQHDAVQKIINEGQNLIRKTVHDARLEIREVLTPAQLEQFDELIKRPFRRPLFNTNGAPDSVASTNSSVTNPVTK